ncbi:MerR family transcriptional regulator [uncultured Akkermansia sp.]|uniref:MerR family transcriptional regulator n=1 Tax=uncultured Akkermansia sp. TaxID=512294 RepID=UPI00259A5AF2|nr:MerR family transcriptional regulator [uncultured Akkermansia sp.]
MYKRQLLTIGNISKQTGVHIKSLRYYDKIGILPPAHVDTETGYRYYDFSQIQLVEAIQLCVELDIPLNRFTEFLTEDKKSIRYGKLIAYGSMLADEKIRAINTKLHILDEMQKHIRHAENYRFHNGPIKLAIPEKYCWALPYRGRQRSTEYHLKFNRALEDISRRGLKTGSEAGILMMSRGGVTERFLYIEVDMEQSREPLPEEIIHLQELSCVCMKTDHSDIEQAAFLFPDLFSREYDRIVMETELFPDHYYFSHPHYEIRCSVPDGGA